MYCIQCIRHDISMGILAFHCKKNYGIELSTLTQSIGFLVTQKVSNPIPSGKSVERFKVWYLN